jgi:integrase
MSTTSSQIDLGKYHKTRHRGLSYRLLADGSRRYYGYVPQRGRVQLRGTGERDAVAEYGDIRGRAAKGERVAPANVRFAAVAEEWLESKHRLRAWTRKTYREALDLVLIPRFGHMKLGQIDADAIAKLIRDLESRGLNAVDPKRPVRPLSASSISNYTKPLSGTLAFAVRRGLIGANPYRALTSDDRPDAKAGRKKTREWSQDEIDALLEATDIRARQRESQCDYSPLIRTAVFTGLRLGELLGLQWGDVELDNGVLHVRRQWTRMGELAAPKTKKGLRRVPLTAELVRRLREHKLASSFSQDGDFVFASLTGGPLSHRNVQRRGFEPARDLAELDSSVTFHDLRHAFASIAASRGIPVNVLSEIMGHSNIGVTQQVYIHLFGRDQAEDAFRKAMGA